MLAQKVRFFIAFLICLRKDYLFQSSCRTAIRRQLHRRKGHQRTMPKADFISAGARRSEGVFGGAAGG